MRSLARLPGSTTTTWPGSPTWRTGGASVPTRASCTGAEQPPTRPHGDAAVPQIGVRIEIEDPENQHVDLVHLAHAAQLLDHRPVAVGVTGYLVNSPGTSRGMYAHDRRTLDTVVAAVDTGPAAGLDHARSLVTSLALSMP